ncbi:NAD(P)-dependent oxidoreductase [Cryptosporangium arvum]|uniref:Beta-hydroxyacid dehydrogenase, 3-hydroxyisobutyrate dehydrogenase n=1 Tax=Cryptosporangium arvum DSM 44712 TaxID=927661 RepID=A0A010YMW7_9ACTN|nr:NAD(P)-binding domain-containing protein [Cryptosporangium arvum]EXG81555.1 beta-hydroxyacid dehydrogenase, 3-hydroxyisobutyrate dehydrogenase [Cryptosporangium arvum DSM 44712]
MSTIGFVGLGVMGAPMARHLVTAGHDVTGFDVHTPAVDAFAADGGAPATSVADAVRGADVVITMLPNHPQVEEVAAQVLPAVPPGTLFADMSSIRPETSVRLAAEGAATGVRVIDAPVSGGQTGARQATLSIMVGGDEVAFAAARPVLEVLGTPRHVGGAGAGQVVKAANQLVVAGIYALVSEAIVLLEGSDVGAKTGLDVLAGGLAASRILDLKRESMLAREFTPGFRIDLHHKDMAIALDAARDAGVALPVTGLVAQLVAAARAMGHGSLDHSALLKVTETLSGREA